MYWHIRVGIEDVAMKRLRDVFSNSIALFSISLLMTGAAMAQQKLIVPAYVEETATAGISSSYQGEWQYMVGGGVAAFDCNGDGYPDLAFAGGEGSSSLYVNKK